jgi:hypothetical protein
MADNALWGEMLDVLKDIGEYLNKQDAHQEQAKIDKPPKIGENQAKQPIKGGEAPGFGPGKDALVQKEYPGVVNEPRVNDSEPIDAKEGTLLKEDNLEALEEDGENEDYRDDEPSEYQSLNREDRGDEDEELELKSILKDIRSALNVIKSSKSTESSKTKEKSTKSSESVSKSLVDGVVTEIKKALPSIVSAESHRMLRKMGFSPSRPDIVKFGLDEDIKKSEDVKDESKEVEKVVNELSHKSWGELGALRESTGGFNAFSR